MTDDQLTPIPGATLRYDDDGHAIVDIATCGTCGRSWNDALVSSVTPVPSGRCPFEYEHEEEETADRFTLTIELGNDAMQAGPDVAAALRAVADRIESDLLAASDEGRGTIRDANGNTVGRWAIS